jgi:patatin-like phospholipase/acyl hydrolase
VARRWVSSIAARATHETTYYLESESVKPFRILSLDGGGVKGTFTAAVLAELESMSKKRLWQHFDLITGTSTGGIIAIALGLGVPAAGNERVSGDHP